LITNDSEYGVAGADLFELYFKKMGGEIVARESVLPGEREYSSVLIRAKAKALDMIAIIQTSVDAGYTVKQAKRLGIKAKLLGATALYWPGFFLRPWFIATLIGAPARRQPCGSSPAKFILSRVASSSRARISVSGRPSGISATESPCFLRAARCLNPSRFGRIWKWGDIFFPGGRKWKTPWSKCTIYSRF